MSDLVFDGLAFQANYLLGPGPIQITRVDDVGRSGNRSSFNAAAVLFRLGSRLSIRFFLLHFVGGKSLRGSRRLVQCPASIAVGSLSREQGSPLSF